MFCGIIANEKGEEDYKCRTILRRNKIEKSELQSYVAIRSAINKIKKEIGYLAYSDEQKLETLIEEKEKVLGHMRNKLDILSQWWLTDLVDILNTRK